MGGSLLGGLFDVILGGDESKVSSASAADTEEASRKAKQGRAALYETEGGVAGSELNPDQVKRRNTLLGN